MKKQSHSFQRIFSLLLFTFALALAGCAQATPPPTATAIPTTTREPIPPTPTLAPLSLEYRKNTFEAVWTLVKHRYAYAGFGGVDWDAVHAEFAPKVEADARPAAFYSLLNEMLARLPKETAYYQTPQEVKAENAPQGEQWYGIGAQVRNVPEGGLIVGLVPGAPGEQAGLKTREIILEVNGTRFIEDPAFGPGGPLALIRGPAGTPVELKIQGLDGKARSVRIVRQPITDYSALDSPRVLRLADTNVVYVQPPVFYNQIAQDIQRALEKLSPGGKFDGLILDLRFQNGGAVQPMLDLLGLFMESQVIGEEVGRNSKSELRVVGDSQTPALKQLPMVVLVNQDTVPIVPAIMQKFKRAKVIGVPTHRASEMQEIFELLDGSQLVLATKAIVFPGGTPLGNVQPDRVVDEKWYLVPFDQDPQIQAAVEELKKGVPQ